jgi:hypothetical protein
VLSGALDLHGAIKNFGFHWAKGSGVADVETGLPVAPHTLFQAEKKWGQVLEYHIPRLTIHWS